MILNRTSIAGTLLGVYYALSLLLFLNILSLSVGHVNNEGRYLYPSFKEMINGFNAGSFIKIPNSQIFIGISVTLIFFVFSVLFKKGLMATRMSQIYEEASKSISWGLRNILTSGLLIVCIFSVGLTYVIGRQSNASYLNLIIYFTIFLMSIIIPPFFLLNKAVLNGKSIGKWYIPVWPGLSPLLIWILGVGIGEVADFFMSLLSDKQNAVYVSYSILWFFIDTWIVVICLSVFIYRLPFSALGREIRSRMNLRFLSAWILMEAKLFYYFAWLFPIAFLAVFSRIYVYPVLKSTPDTASITLWPAIELLAIICNFFKKDYIVLLPLAVLFLLIAGRFLIRIDTLSERSSFIE